MRLAHFFPSTEMMVALGAFLALQGAAPGQDIAERQEPATSSVGRPSPSNDETIKSIDDDYARQLIGLERHRLSRLERLAARQKLADAATTYEKLFRLAIAGNLFGDAETAAKAVLGTGSPSVAALGLAHAVKIIAEADRGDYEQSLKSLRLAVADGEIAAQGGAPRAGLPTDELVEICDAYYQRLIQGARYENAQKALRILLEATRRPILKEFLTSRLRRLEPVGKAAPAIQGTDLDGKPFDLSEFKGKKAVLVVFWASWCLPCESEVQSLHEVEAAYRGRGFQIVGINLDASSSGDQKAGSVLPNVRRFLLDYNVNWPTLMNGEKEKDYAAAYGVTEIPANVLVGKDGTVLHIDLVRKNLEPTIARVVGQ
jgi:thiol-disulfide isomerase/thioredoxin